MDKELLDELCNYGRDFQPIRPSHEEMRSVDEERVRRGLEPYYFRPPPLPPEVSERIMALEKLVNGLHERICELRGELDYIEASMEAPGNAYPQLPYEEACRQRMRDYLYARDFLWPRAYLKIGPPEKELKKLLASPPEGFEWKNVYPRKGCMEWELNQVTKKEDK